MDDARNLSQLKNSGNSVKQAIAESFENIVIEQGLRSLRLFFFNFFFYFVVILNNDINSLECTYTYLMHANMLCFDNFL